MAIKRLLCLECGAEVDVTKDLRGCPQCGDTRHVPADLNDTVTITLARHELRILTMWASNWAERCSGQAAIRTILTRLGAQTDTALTLSQEIADVQAAFPDTTVQLFRNGKEVDLSGGGGTADEGGR